MIRGLVCPSRLGLRFKLNLENMLRWVVTTRSAPIDAAVVSSRTTARAATLVNRGLR